MSYYPGPPYYGCWRPPAPAYPTYPNFTENPYPQNFFHFGGPPQQQPHQGQQFGFPHQPVAGQHQPHTKQNTEDPVKAESSTQLKQPQLEDNDGSAESKAPAFKPKDYHLAWQAQYDKPITETIVTKCKPLYCELCSVGLNSPIQAKMHYEGKNHDKKVRFALQNWAKDNNTVPPRKVKLGGNTNSQQLPEAHHNNHSVQVPMMAPQPNLHCNLCDISFTSAAHAEQHYAGRNHQRIAQGLAPLKAGYFNPKTGKWQRKPPNEMEQAAQDGLATLMTFSSAHNDPVTAAVTAEALQNPPPPPPDDEDKEKPPLPGSSPTPSGSSGTTPPVSLKAGAKFYCSICDISTTSEPQLDMHIQGKTHKSKCEKFNCKDPYSVVSTASQIEKKQQHLKVMSALQDDPPPAKKAKKAPKMDCSVYRTPSGQYYCALCNACLNSEQQFVQHTYTRRHKIKESSAKSKRKKDRKK